MSVHYAFGPFHKAVCGKGGTARRPIICAFSIENFKQESNRCKGCNQWVAASESRAKPDQKFDAVEKPAHYNQGGIECIDALAAATVNLTGIEAVCTANAIKYLWRWKGKNGVEDLKKARWYIDRLIKLSEKK